MKNIHTVSKTILMLFFICGLQHTALVAQKPSQPFLSTIDSLLNKRPVHYEDIHTPFKQFVNDTNALRYFANKSLKANYNAGSSYSLNHIGIIARKNSEFRKALILHDQALQRATYGNNIEFKIFSLNMLGTTYRRTDAIPNALDYHQKALELSETIENPNVSILRSRNVALNGIGNIYITLKKYDLALEKFYKSLPIEEELNNKLGMAINHQNIGACLEEQGFLNKSLQEYRKSLHYNNLINSDLGRVICNTSISQVYLKQNRLQEAVRLLEPTLQLAIAQNRHYITSSVHISLGKAYLALGEHSKADNILQEGLQLSIKHKIANSISLTYGVLSELASAQNDYKTALEHLKKAEEFEDKILDANKLRYVNDLIIRYDTEKKNNQIKELASANEIVELKLKRNKNTLIIGLISLAAGGFMLYILYHQFQLKNEKKLLTLEQSMLRSQMNPHFLFNSLNAIKLYIINNEKQSAVHYLNKFAKLVRKILEASSVKETTLADELDTVDLYMNIENMRFSNQLDFNVTLAPNIDIYSIKMPSLVLQPFLENAIWHGVSHKEGKKKIDITVDQFDDVHTIITITDNGVGRAFAEKLKSKRIVKRKSVGIANTKERLANFSKEYQNKYFVTITDLYDPQGSPSGTKITMRIPVI